MSLHDADTDLLILSVGFAIVLGRSLTGQQSHQSVDLIVPLFIM